MARYTLCTILCDKVCQWLATGWWFSWGTPVSSTNKTYCHDIIEILLIKLWSIVPLMDLVRICNFDANPEWPPVLIVWFDWMCLKVIFWKKKKIPKNLWHSFKIWYCVNNTTVVLFNIFGVNQTAHSGWPGISTFQIFHGNSTTSLEIKMH